mmetsp:Transcript_6928/g.19451  ORF Transcript_6928/g.19451 Transcript_6928/m.19451 type:complete len:122 (+) Transcript_6928:112-477(+)
MPAAHSSRGLTIWYLMKVAYLPSLLESSSCEPSSTMTPWSSTRILVAPFTVDRRCAMMNVVLPFISCSRASCTTCSFSASSALVASSSSRTRGSRITARAMATRCFWPPDRRHARSPALVA